MTVWIADTVNSWEWKSTKICVIFLCVKVFHIYNIFISCLKRCCWNFNYSIWCVMITNSRTKWNINFEDFFSFEVANNVIYGFWHLDELAFLRVVLSCKCQVLLCMLQVQLMVCCNKYWYLQPLRWFCSKLLLLLKVSYLAFESILVLLCLQGEVGRKHLQGSFYFCSSLNTLSTYVR